MPPGPAAVRLCRLRHLLHLRRLRRLRRLRLGIQNSPSMNFVNFQWCFFFWCQLQKNCNLTKLQKKP